MEKKYYLSEEGLIRYTKALDLIFPSREEADQHRKDIAALQENKVSKEEGKSLIPEEDLAQIETNKNDIADLQENKADKTDLKGVTDRVTGLEEKVASSIRISSSAPQEPAENTVWFDLQTRLVKVWNGSQWISFGAVYQ